MESAVEGKVQEGKAREERVRGEEVQDGKVRQEIGLEGTLLEENFRVLGNVLLGTTQVMDRGLLDKRAGPDMGQEKYGRRYSEIDPDLGLPHPL